ncbi:putative anti-sigma-28 factor, FlgM [Vulgatibacter incomptus]|uniref:Putative anti-sigma-28 factor, FlgM n=2 Tax=Vulgatibacter incomptus TaxID=1391653 RepID=A0A0K1PHI1_9BACT|nr:putative anti-sigma-28 factor, FlgM [Vulgatibacter incomptus]
MTPKDIHDIASLPAARSATGVRPRHEAATAPVTADPVLAPRAPDKVTTDTQRELQAAVEHAKSTSGETRTARLAEIEAQVRKGNYKPDPARIAQRILDEAELLAQIHAILRT